MKTLEGIEKDLEALERATDDYIKLVNLKAKRRPWPFVFGGWVLGLAVGLFF